MSSVDSRDAVALPGRLAWKLRPSFRAGFGIELRATQACCVNGELRLRLIPGIGRFRVELPASSGAIGQWPAGWLAGLGTPWNTLQLGGSMALSSTGMNIETVQGRWRLAGAVVLELQGRTRAALQGVPGKDTMRVPE